MFTIYQHSFAASLQYECLDLKREDEAYLDTGTEKERKDYCENILGYKYSTQSSLVPGCIDYETGDHCASNCCAPKNAGKGINCGLINLWPFQLFP